MLRPDKVTVWWEGLTITAVYKGDRPAMWDDHNYNHHIVYVTSPTGKTSFDFWESIAKGRTETREDVLSALSCFLSDAMAGGMSFAEFCSEFGYDEDSRKAYRTWIACRKANEKAERVISDTYALANKLSEMGI